MGKKGRPDLRRIPQKSVDELEGASAHPPYDSPLVERVAEARKIPIGALNPSETRLLISQQQAPQYVVPRAFEILESDPWIWANFYPGDLLKALFQLDRAYWPPGREWVQRADNLIQAALASWYELPAGMREEEIRRLLIEKAKTL